MKCFKMPTFTNKTIKLSYFAAHFTPKVPFSSCYHFLVINLYLLFQFHECVLKFTSVDISKNFHCYIMAIWFKFPHLFAEKNYYHFWHILHICNLTDKYFSNYITYFVCSDQNFMPYNFMNDNHVSTIQCDNIASTGSCFCLVILGYFLLIM